ncbi:MAG: hypothetical protein ACYTHN_23065, partial [Planctomycetota bacterium]
MPREKVKTIAWSLGAAIGFSLPLVLAFPPVDLGPLILLAFVPWLWILEGMRGFQAAAFSYVLGMAFLFLALFWVTNVTFVGLLIAVFVVALFYAAAGFSIWGLRRTFGFPLALAAPLSFVTIDLSRNFLFSGFPWVYAGHALYRQQVMIQIADLAGSYGVTAVVLAV